MGQIERRYEMRTPGDLRRPVRTVDTRRHQSQMPHRTVEQSGGQWTLRKSPKF